MKKEEMICLENAALAHLDLVNQDEWRLKLHLMPPVGWLNDPNGLCQYKGIYHVYYQYSPYDVHGKTKFWGHYTSKDLLNWRREKTVFYPDHLSDENGVYSGSTYLSDNKMHVFYTGNIKYTDKEYDYVNHGREQNLVYVTSEDGFHFSEKRWLMSNTDYPKNLSCHVRDPKVFEWQNKKYLILGARDKESQGCALILKSDNLINWSYETIIRSSRPFGYMWECPDMVFLDQRQLLITCPQGIKQDGINYANVHQCGYFMIKEGTEGVHVELESFEQLDWGHDFYAPQTFIDQKGRTILIGWMGLPDIEYSNPTIEKGWQHALTLPRELHVKNGKVLQQPVEEFKQLRKNVQCLNAQELNQQKFNKAVFELEIKGNDSFTLFFSSDCTLCWNQELLTLAMGESGRGRTPRSVEIEKLSYLRIIADTSSIEIFVNDGEKVFTSRFYATLSDRHLTITENTNEILLYELNSLTIDWNLN